MQKHDNLIFLLEAHIPLRTKCRTSQTRRANLNASTIFGRQVSILTSDQNTEQQEQTPSDDGWKDQLA